MTKRNKQDLILFIIFSIAFMAGVVWTQLEANCMQRAKEVGLFGQGIGEWQCFWNPSKEFK